MKKLLLLLLLSLGLIGISYAGDSQEAVEREIAEFEAELADELLKQAQAKYQKGYTETHQVQSKASVEAERAAEKEAFEKEQYNRLLTEAVQAEEDLARQLIIEDQLNTLKSAYINNIAARVKIYWHYQGAEDDWECTVYVLQDREGNVEAVNIQKCNLDNSEKAKAFKNSIERAVYIASPLPLAPDDAVFNREILFLFRAY